MKRLYNIIYALALVLLLIIIFIIKNEIVKGILLFLFAAVLIGNTIYKLMAKEEKKLGSKVFYSVLLLFEAVLAIGAIVVIAAAVI